MGERIKVLITVKTYPTPSKSYEELVCTAGVREDGGFIRLYPVNFRYRPYSQQYKKYNWIEVEIKKNLKDPRPESFIPQGEITVLGEPIKTTANWAERKKHVLRNYSASMCELNGMSQKQISLAVVKPRIVKDFVIEKTDRSWKPQIEARMRQLRLFGPDRKPLEKVPYKFSYDFLCEMAGCKGHKMMIEDWEVYELYRRMRDDYHDEAIACQKVKDKFYGEICREDKDTYFFVGTVLKHGTWIILGTFYPKKSGQTPLLSDSH